MVDLKPGDVLSYSAGSTRTDPLGFRKLRTPSSLQGTRPALDNMLAVAGGRWPEFLAALGERPVLFINAYPASLGAFSYGITVDTYLSVRTLSRALQLASAGDHPVILLGQPLVVADAFLRHVAADYPLPETLMLWVGGYATPRSLERMLESLLAPRLRQIFIVHYFGAAEVDAGCLTARQRNAEGELIYYPRDDVEPVLDGGDLLLTLRSPDGEPIVERFRTGDRARRHGEGWVIWNPKRLHPAVDDALESWSDADWQRRTGYLRRADEKIRFQLREGETPRQPAELEFFDFARHFGFSWLDKPCWK